MDKYGVKEPEKYLENEITKFVQGEKLTDVDLQRLDSKLKKIYQIKRANQHLKSTLSQSLMSKKTNLNKSQPDLLPKIQEQKNPNLNSTINQNMRVFNTSIKQKFKLFKIIFNIWIASMQ